MKILECVPNFSEGRNVGKVRAILDTLKKTPGVRLLDYSLDKDHHRSVATFIGEPEDVLRGALNACGKALVLIDMRKHRQGVHPRIGAVDVVPFIPLGSMSMEEAVAIAHRFGKTFGEANALPVYYYGEAALDSRRRELPVIRKGSYEGFSDKMNDPLWLPDAGPAVFNERTGTTAVGARMPLVAYNINLKSDNIAAAKEIAHRVRESGGGLPHVRAMGVFLASRNIVQVSMNLTNYRGTPIPVVFDHVQEEAKRYGIEVLESELIGLIPLDALGNRTPEELKLRDFSENRIIETCLKTFAKSV